MNSVEKILKQVSDMTPKTGHNLAGLDDFGKPDEQGLYFIAHFDSLEAANAEKSVREQKNPGQRYYVYSAE